MPVLMRSFTFNSPFQVRLKPDTTYLLPRRVLLEKARAAQNVAQRVVIFMTRVFVQVVVGRDPRILSGPRPGPRRRIVDGESIEQAIGIEPRDLFVVVVEDRQRGGAGR